MGLEGIALINDDVRSDNLCFFDQRMGLVDLSQALRCSPLNDLSYVTSFLPLEGGPDPYEVMPQSADWAAYRSGAFALRMIKDTDAPDWLNKVFLRLTIITLKWAENALELPAWDGRDWQEI